MDQNSLVIEQVDIGAKLINALRKSGFEIDVAFWAKPSEDEKWFLYLASPVANDKGPTAAYRHVNKVLRETEGQWIDPLDVRVVGSTDSIAQAVLAILKSRIPESPFAVQYPAPYRGMTRYSGSSLGGISIDGALIYPPAEVAFSET